MSSSGTIQRGQLTPAALGGISSDLRAPLYHQIFVVFRDRILSGVYRLGETLPAEQQIMQSYGISRITVKRAFNELAHAGLVSRARGRGTVVTYQSPTPLLRSPASNWLDSMVEMGRQTSVEVLDLNYRPATTEEARALAIEPGDEIQRAVRVRSMGQNPFSHLTTVVPADIGRHFDANDLAKSPLLKLLARAGIDVGDANQVITATLADQATAVHLQTELGAPLLRLQRIVRDRQGRPIQFLTALYRTDRYQLEMALTSEQASEKVQ